MILAVLLTYHHDIAHNDEEAQHWPKITMAEWTLENFLHIANCFLYHEQLLDAH